MKIREPRVHVQARLAYRQTPSAGLWTVVDASGAGICAVGDIEGLDLSEPVEVFIDDGKRSVHARLSNVWVRDGGDVMAHGWRILGLVPDELAELLALLADGETDTATPPEA